ncbi:hypothetical protein BX600DRAFT_442818 [Xylariales sp. PMI_506]|nr:hypothetical protein BX600DRAFT_442818 [Xylariales sp. PMI_506]
MDQSSYNNIYRNASPLYVRALSSVLSPKPGGSAASQGGMTRKWVEAKTQNYDGDDWGNDYDDDIDEEPPLPPAPPPLSQSSAARPGGRAGESPVSQLPSVRAFSQPSAALSHLRGESSGVRIPSGPPALQIQPPRTGSAVSGSGGSAEGPSSSVADSRPGNMDHTQPADVQKGEPLLGPVSQRRSPPPAAGSMPSYHPPRETGLGQPDTPGPKDLEDAKAGSLPSSAFGSQSGAYQRSDSRSPTISDKPLPFVRPADIYRRMEEEKRKSLESQRQSLEAVRRASTDLSPPAASSQKVFDHRRLPSFEKDDDAEMFRGLKSKLAPVTEKQNPYGLERIINEDQGPSTGVPKQSPIPDPAVKEQSAETDLDAAKDRRLSVSPKLPVLARMSVFGDDFFSSSSVSFSSDLDFRKPDSPVPPLPLQSPHREPTGKVATLATHFEEPNPHRSGSHGSDASDDIEQDETHGPSAPVQEPPSTGKESIILTQFPGKQSVSPPREKGSPQVKPLTTVEEKPLRRPSVPGGWVSETTNVDSGKATPMERPEYSIVDSSKDDDNVVVPALADAGVAGSADSKAALKTSEPLRETPVTSADAAVVHGADEGSSAGDDDKRNQPVLDNMASELNLHHHTPQDLPKLQTTTPLPRPMEQELATDSPSKYSSSTHPRTGTTTEFTPTAPLNPQRGNLSAADFVAPDFLPRKGTLSSVDTSSPAHESDRLREDIIKSLSPVASPNLPHPLGSATTSDQREVSRESRYLSDFYEDYLGSSEDIPIPGEPTREQRVEAANIHKVSVEAPTKSAPTSAPTSAPSEAQTKSEFQSPIVLSEPPSLNRRFSWEKGSEQVMHSPADALADASTKVAPQTESSDGELITDAKKSPVVSALSVSTDRDIHGSGSPPGLNIEHEKPGTISHQVSLVSSNAPVGLGLANLEPPSPISVMSSEKGPEPAASREKELPPTEEKVLLHISSQQVPPSPPSGQHPALAEPVAALSPGTTGSATASPNPSSQPFNIMGWRQILSLPSPEMRIQKFDEVREKYTAMDSGLANWITYMKSQPEHVAALPTLTVPAQPPAIAALQSPTGPGNATQQPYYQQYLNASSPNLVGSMPPGPTRTNTMGAQAFTQQPPSAFGPSGNQVAAKSKEFLQTAGALGNKATKSGIKSGMKLFNKGKNKLRGTGDKVFQ